MLCQRCQAEIDTRFPRPDGTIQCPICGLVYQPVVQQPQPAQCPYGNGSQQPSAQKTSAQITQHRRSAAPAKKKNKIWLAALAVAVIAALGAGIFFIASGKNGSGALFSAQASSAIVAEHLEDSAIYDGLYDLEEGEYAGADAEKLIPISVYSSVDAYSAGEPIVFNVDILGGTPPFTVNLNIEEGMMNEDGAETDLTRYLKKTNYAGTSASITTSERHLTWQYTPPANGLSLVLYASVQDAKNCGNLSYNDAIAIKAAMPINYTSETDAKQSNTNYQYTQNNANLHTANGGWQYIDCPDLNEPKMTGKHIRIMKLLGSKMKNDKVGNIYGRYIFTNNSVEIDRMTISKPAIPERLAQVVQARGETYVLLITSHIKTLVFFDVNTEWEVLLWYDWYIGHVGMTTPTLPDSHWILNISNQSIVGIDEPVTFSFAIPTDSDLTDTVTENNYPIPDVYLNQILEFIH